MGAPLHDQGYQGRRQYVRQVHQSARAIALRNASNEPGTPRPDHGLERSPGLEGVGTRRELDELFSAAYEELRRLAATIKRGDGSLTLSPTALVNEAWLKLARSPRFRATSPLHFKRIAARAMRQVLVEAARRRQADKRGGGAPAPATIDVSAEQRIGCGEDLLALDVALDDLARLEPRQALMVESRFFGGFEVAEIARLLDVSEATILRDWRAARAWLAHELARR